MSAATPSEKTCRRCRLPQTVSSDHERGCTWHPSNRVDPFAATPSAADPKLPEREPGILNVCGKRSDREIFDGLSELPERLDYRAYAISAEDENGPHIASVAIGTLADAVAAEAVRRYNAHGDFAVLLSKYDEECKEVGRLRSENESLRSAGTEAAKLLRAASDYMNTVANNQDARWMYADGEKALRDALFASEEDRGGTLACLASLERRHEALVAAARLVILSDDAKQSHAFFRNVDKLRRALASEKGA